MVTVELDEKNNSLQITAALKSDPSIRVSCSFSRGGEDEKISQKVEQIIQELNQEGKLTEKGVQKAYKLAGEVVYTANQIQGQNGKVQADRLNTAQEKLKELEKFACDDYHRAQEFLSAFEFVLECCDFLLPDSQKQRLQNLCSQIKDAIATNNLSAIQKLSEDAKQELNNLPELVTLILVCKDAIARAYQVAPTQASAMAGKFSQMIEALKRQDRYEAEGLLRELLGDMRPYLEQEITTGSISTGLRQ